MAHQGDRVSTFSFSKDPVFKGISFILDSGTLMTGSPGGISLKTSTPSAGASNGLSKASANGGGDTAAGGNSTPSKSMPKRVEVDTLMTEFQAHLGPNWDRYRDVITHFLTGKFFLSAAKENRIV